MSIGKITKDFFQFLENLKPEDWNKKINDKWTIKDVVAHLVAWERECAICLPAAWGKKENPWFIKTDNYDEFNERAIQMYKDYSPEELLSEWKKWQDILEKEAKKIGENSLRSAQFGLTFDWFFDEGENNHYLEHFNEIKKVFID